MPLETATYISQLVAANPGHTDQLNLDDSHMRLIKSTLLATFPNFTAVALASTQAQLDAAVAATGASGVLHLGDGTVAAPTYSFGTDTGTGWYKSALHEASMAINGVQTGKWTATGLDLLTFTLNLSAAAHLTVGGVAVFPLQSANIGAAQVLTAAIADANVTYAKIQNVTNGKILGNFSGGAAAASEYGLGAGLAQSGGNIVALGAPRASTSPDLLIVNDGTLPNTKVNITADEAVLTDRAGNAKYFANVSVSIDTTTTGVNAMGANTGARTATTEYYWWLISNGTTVAGLGSKQKTYATLVSAGDLPGGYTLAVRVGANFTDGSSNLLRVRQAGRRAQYLTGTRVANGSVGSIGTPTWVFQSLTGLAPATALSWYGSIGNVAGTAMLAPNNSYGANGSTTNSAPVIVSAGNAGSNMMLSFTLLLETLGFYWATGNTTQVFITGWDDAV